MSICHFNNANFACLVTKCNRNIFILGIYTLFTLIFKKLTFMIINFKLFVIFAPNIRIRLDFSNRSNDI